MFNEVVRLSRPQVPKSHWQSMENRRKFFDEVAINLNIKNASDWGKVTIRQFCKFGGAGILNYYNNSLFSCLQSVYKGTFKRLHKVQGLRYQMEKGMV